MKINYLDIGKRIRRVRHERGITQEQLAELVNVGTTHISHLETGNTIPSLKLFIAIVNALDISADELLCDFVKNSSAVFEEELQKELQDCTPEEIRIITDVAKATKCSLRKRRGDLKRL